LLTHRLCLPAGLPLARLLARLLRRRLNTPHLPALRLTSLSGLRLPRPTLRLLSRSALSLPRRRLSKRLLARSRLRLPGLLRTCLRLELLAEVLRTRLRLRGLPGLLWTCLGVGLLARLRWPRLLNAVLRTRRRSCVLSTPRLLTGLLRVQLLPTRLLRAQLL
jgi:hypothetical protein